MRHGYKKIKFGYGKDANDMLMRKLAYNFFTNGKIVTTDTKAKVLKSYVEKLVEKLKEKNEANKNSLLRSLGSQALIDTLYETVTDKVKGIQGGYVRVQRLAIRLSDGAPTARLSWTFPMVKEEKKAEKKEVKKSAEKVEKPSSVKK